MSLNPIFISVFSIKSHLPILILIEVDSQTESSKSSDPCHNNNGNSIAGVVRRKRRFLGCSLITSFDILENVGEGTFGEVHKAKVKKDGRLVALKKILIRAEQEGVSPYRSELSGLMKNW